MANHTYIEIIKYEGTEVVKRIDVSDMNERQINKIDDGFNINLNHDAYYTLITESEEKLPIIG